MRIKRKISLLLIIGVFGMSCINFADSDFTENEKRELKRLVNQIEAERKKYNNKIASDPSYVDGIYNVIDNSKYSDVLGDLNEIRYSKRSFVRGDKNIVKDSMSHLHIEGNENKINESYNVFIMGSENMVKKSPYNIIFGNENKIEDESLENWYNLLVGSKNTVKKSSNITLFGKDNKIEKSNYSYTNGKENEITNSGNSYTNGEGNKIKDSMHSYAEGGSFFKENKIDKSIYSYIKGNENTINESDYSHEEGEKNKIDNSPYSYIRGENNNIIESKYSFIYGKDSKIENAENSAILAGNNSIVNVKNSIALGAYSITQSITNLGYLTNQSTNDIYALSIGGKDGETIVRRRIQGLADGYNDDEAVTVAQLKSIIEQNPFEYTLKSDINTKVVWNNGKFMKVENGEYKDLDDQNDIMIRSKHSLQLGNIRPSNDENIRSGVGQTRDVQASSDNGNNVVTEPELKEVKTTITETKNTIATLSNKVSTNERAIQGINEKIQATYKKVGNIKEDVLKIKEDVKKIDKKTDLALSGVSSAVAMANLPQVSGDRKFNLAASYGYYGGSHAVAVGLSGTNDKQNFTYKLSGAVNSKGNLAFGIGAGVMMGSVNDKDKVIEQLKEENRKRDEKIDKQGQEIKELKEIVNKLIRK